MVGHGKGRKPMLYAYRAMREDLDDLNFVPHEAMELEPKHFTSEETCDLT